MSHMIFTDDNFRTDLTDLSPEQLQKNIANRARMLDALNSQLNCLQSNAKLISGKTQKERKRHA